MLQLLGALFVLGGERARPIVDRRHRFDLGLGEAEGEDRRRAGAASQRIGERERDVEMPARRSAQRTTFCPVCLGAMVP